MLARVFTGLVRGLEARLVEVQVDVAAGLPGFFMVGLASGSVREAKERVRSAIRNSGLSFPLRRLTVNLAPAELKKDGTGLDFAIAMGICLAAEGRASPAGSAFLGEVALDGGIHHVDGVLVLARGLATLGISELLVPVADAAEAALAGALRVVPCPSLRAAVAHLTGEAPIDPVGAAAAGWTGPEPAPAADLAEVHGQEWARRALEVAAAGGHHLLLTGPPGAGKTMLARCLPGLLPPLDLEEALEVAQIRSVLGELPAGGPLDRARPFRAPHHSVSIAGLVGGGAGLAGPGEISRAHHGVLFLDELAEFNPAVLQSLRQPMELGTVSLTRSGGAISYPARFQLVAATNPCPCGFLGDEVRRCKCPPGAVRGYQRSLSGPILDRIDIHVGVPRASPRALVAPAGGEATRAVRERVVRARALQAERQGDLNAALRPRDLRRLAPLTPEARGALERWIESRGLSARGFHRAWRVARTLADLDGGRPVILESHALEALGYREAEVVA